MAAKLLTAADVARRLGITIATVHRRAAARGLGQWAGSMRLFAERDLARLDGRTPGSGRHRKTNRKPKHLA